MLHVLYWTWMPLVCLAVSGALLVRLELRDAAGRPWPQRLSYRLRAGLIEYIMLAVVIIGTIGAGFLAFGGAAEEAFTNLGGWVTTSINNATAAPADGGDGG